MVRPPKSRSMTTRVSQETYNAFLSKCSGKGCSPYEYLRELVRLDLGLADLSEPVQMGLVDEKQEEMKEDERVERGIRITR